MLSAEELREIETAFTSIRNNKLTRADALRFQHNGSTVYLSNTQARENNTAGTWLICPHIYQNGNSYAYMLKGDHVFKVGFVNGEYDFHEASSANDGELRE